MPFGHPELSGTSTTPVVRIEGSTGAGRCARDARHHIVSPQAVHQLRGGLDRIEDLLALLAGWCCRQLVGQLFQAAHFPGAILAQQRLAAVIGPDLFDVSASRCRSSGKPEPQRRPVNWVVR